MREKIDMNRATISRLEKEKRTTVFTSFRGDNLTSQEQDGAEHLLEMVLVAKQQILLRKALRQEESCCMRKEMQYI